MNERMILQENSEIQHSITWRLIERMVRYFGLQVYYSNKIRTVHLKRNEHELILFYLP